MSFYVNVPKEKITVNRIFSSYGEAEDYVRDKSRFYGDIYSIDKEGYEDQMVREKKVRTLHSLCSYCGRKMTSSGSFSYGVPGIPRVYKCNREDCEKDLKYEVKIEKSGLGTFYIRSLRED